MEQKESQHKTTFEFCDKEIKTFKEDLVCQQDSVHKSMVDNPLGFVILCASNFIHWVFISTISEGL